LERKLDDFNRSMSGIEERLYELENKVTRIESLLNSNCLSKTE
jgi:hypothetical protein